LKISSLTIIISRTTEFEFSVDWRVFFQRVGRVAAAGGLRGRADVAGGARGADSARGEAPGAERGAAAVRGRRPAAAAAAGRGARLGRQEGRPGQEPFGGHPRQGQHARRDVRAQPGEVAPTQGQEEGIHHPPLLQMKNIQLF